MARVSFEDVSKVYADGARAVSHMDLEIGDGEFMVLVGPSGCGKTTALRMLAGLEAISSGVIAIGERAVNYVAPKDRDIAMVFQNYALYPHLSVYDNIAFGLRLRKTPRDEVESRVREAARVLGLETLLQRKPRALSGGQRQRVAMGRAIVRQPQAFLMDEPLSNLDAKLRVQMRAEISRLQRDLGVTTVYVTHDQTEAMTMGDRVAVMRRGELLQVAEPRALYERPLNLFVAGFIGSPTMNMLEARLERTDGALLAIAGDQRLALDADVMRRRPALEEYVGRTVVVGVRPEALEEVPQGAEAPAGAVLRGSAELVEALGSEVIVHFRVGAPPVLTEDALELAEDVGPDHRLKVEEHGTASHSELVARFRSTSRVRKGQQVQAAATGDALHFFDPGSGLAIDGHAPDDPLVSAGAEPDSRPAGKEVGSP